jgi:hypothetical protein
VRCGPTDPVVPSSASRTFATRRLLRSAEESGVGGVPRNPPCARQVSNLRPPPCRGGALPLSYSRVTDRTPRERYSHGGSTGHPGLHVHEHAVDGCEPTILVRSVRGCPWVRTRRASGSDFTDRRASATLTTPLRGHGELTPTAVPRTSAGPACSGPAAPVCDLV